jgi:anaerobic magnesium-protoporphyrin IX monomethyl ester cyclase
VERFAEAVGARGAGLPFRCLSRVDLLTPGVVRALREAGCRMVWVGAESGSQRILDAMEKGTRVEQIRESARRLHEAGLEVGFFLQFGYPGETRQDIEQTMGLVRECRPDDIGISVSYPLPGTKFYERVRAQLGEQRNWQDSDDLAMMFRGPYPTGFYRRLHRVVHKEFRLRRLRDQRARSLRGTAALLYHAATLPVERLRLARLARAPHRGIGPIPPSLSPDAAAQPTAQR